MLMSTHVMKPLACRQSSSYAPVSASAEVVEYACGLAPELRGDYIEHVASGMDTYSFRQPLGVRSRTAARQRHAAA